MKKWKIYKKGAIYYRTFFQKCVKNPYLSPFFEGETNIRYGGENAKIASPTMIEKEDKFGTSNQRRSNGAS